MTSPQVRLRPARPAAHSLADLMAAMDLTPSPFIAGADSSAAAAAVGPVMVTGAVMASADVEPGDLFIAVPGALEHGARFVPPALEAGAVAVLTDAAGAALIAGIVPADARVPVLLAQDPRMVAGDVAAWIYDHPARSCLTVGVTGTNGKTTTTYLLDAALQAVHPVTAMFGTVETRIGTHVAQSVRTTVEAPVLQAILALAREEHVAAVSMEVSSHALALGRVNGVVFDVVGFTNLQRDHLDFHGDMTEYFRAKSLLFTASHARRGVVVVDDEWGRRLARETAIEVETLATRVGGGQDADWTVTEAQTAPDGVGSAFVLRGPDGAAHQAVSPIPGWINVSNSALAIVLAYRAGVPLDVAIGAVASARGVPGRMERVLERSAGRPLALVDYAHTPDALALALQSVRSVTPGRVVVVFGAGGDRDRGKRALMGQAAGRYADVVVVTDDNPRSETPAAIRAEILEGVRGTAAPEHEIHDVPDRGAAIRWALDIAREGDTVVVAGKGHESTQEIAGTYHPFSDQEVLRATAAAADRGADA
jgi:UDP-N-acetylmuramoyl-L-alanyl-D-glutamate--2,6-diaminopimelate ligase